MNSIQSIYEQYRTLPQSSKNELLELLNREQANKEQKLKQRLMAMKETESFFKAIRAELPNDYQFNREQANER